MRQNKIKEKGRVSIHLHPNLLIKLKTESGYKGLIKYSNPKIEDYYTNNLVILDSLMNIKNVHSLCPEDYTKYKILEFLNTSNYSKNENINLIFFF